MFVPAIYHLFGACGEEIRAQCLHTWARLTLWSCWSVLKCFFNGPKKWKLLGTMSGLYGGWMRHFQQNCFRNCVVTQTVWGWALLLRKIIFSMCLCSHCVQGCSYGRDYMCTYAENIYIHRTKNPYSKSRGTSEFGLCCVQVLFIEIVTKKIIFISQRLRIFCFMWSLCAKSFVRQMYIYIRTYTHVRAHIHINTHTHIYTYTTYTHAYTYTNFLKNKWRKEFYFLS